MFNSKGIHSRCYKLFSKIFNPSLFPVLTYFHEVSLTFLHITDILDNYKHFTNRENPLLRI